MWPKHAHASAVTICASSDDEPATSRSRDDGVGGAGARGGSGLIGLKDRVEAIEGRLQVVSPAGSGTTPGGHHPVAGAIALPSAAVGQTENGNCA